MLFRVDPHISILCETLLLTAVEGASEIGLCFTGHIPNIVRAKEMVKKEHVGIPSIPGPQVRFDVNKSGMLATYIGHDVPNLAHVIHEGTPRVWRSCRHFLIDSFIILGGGVFFLRFQGNLSSDNIIQCCTSDSIL
jgi:hypothetical protein